MNKLWTIIGLVFLFTFLTTCGRSTFARDSTPIGVCADGETRNLYAAFLPDRPKRCLDGDHFYRIPENGSFGLKCWDMNGNGKRDHFEDINGDGNHNFWDCRGVQGPQGLEGPRIVGVGLINPQPGSGDSPSVAMQTLTDGSNNYRVLFGIPPGPPGNAAPAKTVCVAAALELQASAPIGNEPSSSSYCRNRCPNGVAAHVRTPWGVKCEVDSDAGKCSSDESGRFNYCCVCNP